jgi:hypothetical protein
MFRGCIFAARLARMRAGTERMRHVLLRILVLVLSVGLAASAPALSHTRTIPSAAPASHEVHDVQHYADLSVEPGEEGCPHATPGGTQDQDDSLCKKCCAACLGASLVPSLPVSVRLFSEPSDLTVAPDDMLVARVIPTEPGIPKPL